MADNIKFHSDMADEGHIGKAIGVYEVEKGVIHLSAPSAGNHSVPAANADKAKEIFWDFVNTIDETGCHKPSEDY